MKEFLGGSLLFLAVLGMCCGCSHNEPPKYINYNSPRANAARIMTLTNDVDLAWLRAPTNLFTLGPGDRVEIELMDDLTSKIITVVGPDGKIYFNLLTGLDVWGLTLGQAKAEIEKELGKFIRGVPRVNITLRAVESKRVWLLGRFQEPGVYSMAVPMTLLEAISMAGGVLTFAGTRDVSGGALSEDLADLRHSFIVRNGKLLPVDMDRLLNHGDLTQNIYLQPGDLVYFSAALSREIYVIGAVVQPKPVPYTDGMTLAGAVAGAYGTIRNAYLTHVTIVRGSLAQPQAIVVDYKAIVQGKCPDVPLEPHDIVYVPFSPYRYLRKYVDIALDTFVSAVAINAGTTAVTRSPNASSTGVFIPVGSGVQVIPPPAPPIH